MFFYTHLIKQINGVKGSFIESCFLFVKLHIYLLHYIKNITTNQMLEKKVVQYLSSLADHKRTEIKSLQFTIDAIAESNKIDPSKYFGLDQFLVHNNSPKAKEVLRPVEVFNPESKLDHKISYALYNIGNGFKEDILEVLQQEQPETDPHKLEQAVAVRLSYLLKNGLIDATKIRGRYEYTLKITDAQ